MNDRDRTDQEMLEEISALQKRVRVLERSEAKLKRAEQALRESEGKYRSLASAADSMYLVDRDGRFLLVNERHLARFGLPAGQVIGRLHEEFHSVEDSAIFKNHLKRVFETGEPLQDEYRSARDGRYFVRTLSPVKNDHGMTSSVTVVAKDITERKQAEMENLRLLERLQRAETMEALGTLAGGVAHDLNNVLGIIVGYAELLLNEVPSSSPIRPRLLNIMNGGERAAAIVQDLLTLARRGVPGTQILNLNRIITDDQYFQKFGKLPACRHGIRFETDLEADLLNISGSPVHLSKTLINLVSNGCEAMPNGGVLTIRTANQYIDKPIQGYDEVREGDYVVLSVSDTGEGIPADDLKRIFEPFYTKKVMGRSGTGLGLAVVWGTVKDHHGYINVQSEEGKGSAFTLYFPVTREEITADQVALPAVAYTGREESILVVDDIKGQRELAAAMLKKLNYHVASVAGGEEAVAYLKGHEADLLVLDMIMDPGMDGLDTYRKALEIRPKQKAIIVSGFSESERVTAAQALGAGAYVRKPYVLERLGLAVRKELDRT
jgi:PAS domain S-box-containing protein